MATIRGWLAGIPVRDLHKYSAHPNEVFCVNSEQTLAEAFKILMDRNVTAAPVWNMSSNSFSSFIDLYDILNVLFTPMDEVAKKEGFESFMQGLLQKLKVKELIELPATNPFRSCKPDSSLVEVIEIMQNSHVHRVPVMLNNQLQFMISQTQIIQFFQNNVDKIRHFLGNQKKWTYAFHDKGEGVLHLSTDSTAFDAFKLMKREHISGVAIVKEGKYVSSLSLRDLKLIGTNAKNAELLQLPAAEFAQKMMDTFPGSAKGSKVLYSEKAHLPDVLKVLAEGRFHRVYFLDTEQDQRVKGIASLVDVIGFITADEGDFTRAKSIRALYDDEYDA